MWNTSAIKCKTKKNTVLINFFVPSCNVYLSFFSASVRHFERGVGPWNEFDVSFPRGKTRIFFMGLEISFTRDWQVCLTTNTNQ